MTEEQTHEPSEPISQTARIAQKRFNPLIALQGGHRPVRVLMHGIGYLIEFPVAVFVLLAAGVLRAVISALRSLGLSSSIVGMFPTPLALAYLILWTWFVTSLFNCARHAETPQGMKIAQLASQILGVFSAAAVVVVMAISMVR